jgi:hypothetical protein
VFALNGTCQLLVYAHNVNLLRDNVNAVKESPNCLQGNSSARTTQKTQPLYRCRGVFTAPLHSKVRGGADHTENTPFPAVTLLLRAYSLQWERVDRTVAQKRSLCTESPLSNGSIHHNMLHINK